MLSAADFADLFPDLFKEAPAKAERPAEPHPGPGAAALRPTAPFRLAMHDLVSPIEEGAKHAA